MSLEVALPSSEHSSFLQRMKKEIGDLKAKTNFIVESGEDLLQIKAKGDQRVASNQLKYV